MSDALAQLLTGPSVIHHAVRLSLMFAGLAMWRDDGCFVLTKRGEKCTRQPELPLLGGT
jgi:hypothetical protein